MKQENKKQNKKQNKIIIIIELAIMVLAISTIVGFLACKSKVNPKNYDAIRKTMTYEEIIDLLGKPDDEIRVSTGIDYYWFNGAKNIEDADKKIEKNKNPYYIRIHINNNKVINYNGGYWYNFRNPQE